MNRERAGCARSEEYERPGGPALRQDPHEIVRHEAAVVGVMRRSSSRMPMPAGLPSITHEPTSGVVAVEHRQRLVGLPDEAFAAVVAACGVEHARSDDGDVVALAAEDRLLHEGAAEVGMLAVEGRQQVRRGRGSPPTAAAAASCSTRIIFHAGSMKARGVGQHMRPERLARHPFPRDRACSAPGSASRRDP